VEEQQFEPFFRSVSAVAFSTGTKLKTRVHMLNKVIQLQKAVNGGKVVQTNGDPKAQGGSKACIIM
jgi:hypothetical protein